MPLRDFVCPFCGHSFEAVSSSSTKNGVRCPLCLTVAGEPGKATSPSKLGPQQKMVIEARKLGVATGTRAREGDDLEQYARQYGGGAADNLVSDYWGPDYPPFQELRELAKKLAAGVPWTKLEESLSEAFHDGFVAACGDAYDDSYKSDG